ncbi:hypothetical protein MTO96_037351 [Rhipicephalus appendiculatus]
MSEEASPSNANGAGAPSIPMPRDSKNQPTLKEDGKTINIFFPIPHSFICPNQECSVRYTGVSWTSRCQSLMRHLLEEHELRVTPSYICTLCSSTGLGHHPTRHPCISRGRYELSPLDLYRHKCPKCPTTMSSRKGLHNHMRAHKKQEAQQTTQQSTTAWATGTAPAATPTGRPSHATAANRAARTMTLRSSQSSNSTTSKGQRSSQTSPATSTPPAPPTPPELALIPFSPLLGDMPGIPDDVSATAAAPSSTPSEVTTTRRRSSSVSLFSQDSNEVSTTSSPGQHGSPRDSSDSRGSSALASTQQSRPPSPEQTLTLLPSLLGSVNGSFSHNTKDAATRPGELGTTQRSIAAARKDPERSPTTRNITNSVDSSTQLMSSEAPSPDGAGGESHDPAPQTENPGEITLSGPIDDTSVLSEHTQQIRQLLRKPVTTERWDDFLSIFEDAVSTVRKEANIPDTTAGGKPHVPTNPNNAQQIQGFFQHVPPVQASAPCLKETRTILIHKKGDPRFLPHDGVFEHNLVLQERLDAARAGSGDLCVAFLDFANAFRSVSHNALIDSLRGAVTTSASIRKGCPLSGLLFNLVLDPVIRAVQGAGQLGLRLNPKKCRSLHLSGKTPVGTRETKFFVDGEEIPRIGDYESQTLLGRPVGFSLLPDRSKVDEATSVGRTLLQSMLAPWQRIAAVKTFVFPALNFAMRCGQVGKAEWARLDDALRPLIKKTLYLPGNAANDYLYGSAAAGAAGIPLAAETSDACRVEHAFKLLTSADLEVRELAFDALIQNCFKAHSQGSHPRGARLLPKRRKWRAFSRHEQCSFNPSGPRLGKLLTG